MAVALETTWRQVLAWRMRRSLLDPVAQVAAPDVVRQLCGVQAQVPAAASLAIGVRQKKPVASAMDTALQAGDVMRVWAMRGTLHLLTPDEAGAFLSLMAAARTWEKPSWVRVSGVSPEEMARLTEAVCEVLDGQILTREQLVPELANRLQRPDLEEKLRSGWGSLFKPIAWQGVMCHGPADGNRVTFARPDQLLAGWTGVPDPDDAALVAVPAYLRTYGPATADRFDAWLTRGLSKKRTLRGWFSALEDQLVAVDVEGVSAYLLAEDVDELAETPPAAVSTVRLLPGFDQYVLGPGTAATEIIDSDRRKEVSRAAGWIAPVVVAGGRVVGVWESSKADPSAITVDLFDESESPPSAELEAAIERMRSLL